MIDKNYQARGGKARLPSGTDEKIPEDEFPDKSSTKEDTQKVTLSVPILRPYKPGEDEEKDRAVRQVEFQSRVQILSFIHSFIGTNFLYSKIEWPFSKLALSVDLQTSL